VNRHNRTARPFNCKFTADDLTALLHRISQREQAASQRAALSQGRPITPDELTELSTKSRTAGPRAVTDGRARAPSRTGGSPRRGRPRHRRAGVPRTSAVALARHLPRYNRSMANYARALVEG
jgi:hypothetical protein